MIAVNQQLSILTKIIGNGCIIYSIFQDIFKEKKPVNFLMKKNG